MNLLLDVIASVHVAYPDAECTPVIGTVRAYPSGIIRATYINYRVMSGSLVLGIGDDEPVAWTDAYWNLIHRGVPMILNEIDQLNERIDQINKKFAAANTYGVRCVFDDEDHAEIGELQGYGRVDGMGGGKWGLFVQGHGEFQLLRDASVGVRMRVMSDTLRIADLYRKLKQENAARKDGLHDLLVSLDVFIETL